MQKIAEKLKGNNIDAVLITGDFIESAEHINDDTLDPLNNLNIPIYFVTGNHEGYADLEKTIPILKNSKITILENETTTLKDIEIAGLDYSRDQKILENILKNIKTEDNNFSILMNHDPGITKIPSANNYDLILAGHTHSGQFFPYNFLVHFFHKYVKGLHEISPNKYLHVSQGTGTWGPPIRIGTKNEVTLIKLLPNY